MNTGRPMTDPARLLIADLYAEQKRAHASWAACVWFIACIFLFLSDGGLRSFLTLKALLLFIPGTFLAALPLGAFGYVLQRIVVGGLMPIIRMVPSPAIPTVVRRIGAVLFIVDTFVGFLVARLAYHAW